MKRDQIERLFDAERERPVDAPPFERLWAAARRRRDVRRGRRRMLRAASVAAGAMALGAILLWPPRPASPPDTDAGFDSETHELARTLSGWRGPLDFLLEPPGGHLFGLDPEASTLGLTTELSTVPIEEVL